MIYSLLRITLNFPTFVCLKFFFYSKNIFKTIEHNYTISQVAANFLGETHNEYVKYREAEVSKGTEELKIMADFMTEERARLKALEELYRPETSRGKEDDKIVCQKHVTAFLSWQ